VTPVAAGAFPLTRRHALQYAQPGWRWWAMRHIPFIRWRGRGEPGLSRCRCLLDVLSSARGTRKLGQPPVLKRYQTRRMADNFIMQSGMDLFYAGFSNDLAPVRCCVILA
jgi:2-octaprenyl-3-methyl-6-methoxy-1,4-benzoquinol hydroxylase